MTFNRLFFMLEIFAGVVTPSENFVVFAFPPCLAVSKTGAKPPFMIVNHFFSWLKISTIPANLFHFPTFLQIRA